MKQGVKWRFLSIIMSIMLIIGTLPVDMFGGVFSEVVRAEGESLPNGLQGWSITNGSGIGTNIDISVTEDVNGKVLTIDNKTTSGTIGNGFNNTSILQFTSNEIASDTEFVMEADIKVITKNSANNNRAGFGFGETVSTNKYIMEILTTGSYEKDYGPIIYALKSDESGYNTGTFTNRTGYAENSEEVHHMMFKRNNTQSKWEMKYTNNTDITGDTYKKGVGYANYSADFADTTLQHLPTIFVEGVKIEIRNLIIKSADGSEEYYNLNTAGEPIYNVDATMQISGLSSGVDISGSYSTEPIAITMSTELNSNPTSDDITITAKTGDTCLSGLSQSEYSTEVDAANGVIKIKAGNKVIANISYSIAGQVKRIPYDSRLTWSLKNSDNAIYTAYSAGTEYNDPEGYFKISGGSLSYNCGQHGANLGNNTEFAFNVKAGETKIIVEGCQYGNAAADLYLNTTDSSNKINSETINIKTTSDGGEVVIDVPQLDAPATVILKCTTGGYLHAISVESKQASKKVSVGGTITGLQDLTVSEGQVVVLTNMTETNKKYTGAITNTDGSYSYSISGVPVGAKYSVSLEQLPVYNITKLTVDEADVTEPLELDLTSVADGVTSKVCNIEVEKLSVCTVSGNVDAGKNNEILVFTPQGETDAEQVEYTVSNDSYNVLLKKGVTYSVDFKADSYYRVEDSCKTIAVPNDDTLEITHPITTGVKNLSVLPLNGAAKVLQFDDSAKTFATTVNGVEYAERKNSYTDGTVAILGGWTLPNNTHGIKAGSNGTDIKVTVPKGKTTITVMSCGWGGNYTINITGEGIETQTITATQTDVADTCKKALPSAYVITSVENTVLNINIPKECKFIHSISMKTEEIMPKATVAGSIVNMTTGTDINGKKLVFKKGGTPVAEATINNNSYSVELEIGSVYTVDFEEANMYEIKEGAQIDFSETTEGASVTNILKCVAWKADKSFKLNIGATTFTITPGSDKSQKYSVVKSSEGEKGSVEIIGSDKAIVWADLNAAGKGEISESNVIVADDSVDKGSVVVDNATHTVKYTYKDQTTLPSSFTLIVKDDSASGEAVADGNTITYNFMEGYHVSNLYDSNNKLNGTLNTTDKLVSLISNNTLRYHGTSYGLSVGNGDKITVKVAGNADISLGTSQHSAANNVTATITMNDSSAEVGSINPAEANMKITADKGSIPFKYTGGAATITFTFTGTAYVPNLVVTNEAPKSEVAVEQTQMPEVVSAGTPANLSASASGQRIMLKQTGGDLTTVDDGGSIKSGVSYYGFPALTGYAKLEADVVLDACNSSNYCGIFPGIFNGTHIMTVGVRKGTNLRGIYSKSTADMAGAGIVDANIAAGQLVHYEIVRDSSGFKIDATPQGGKTYTASFKYGDPGYLLLQSGLDTSVHFGFVVAGATATVTNMKYSVYNNDTWEVYYDQNSCYEPIGTAPVPATPVTVNVPINRQFINISWAVGIDRVGDGRYQIEVAKANTTSETDTPTYSDWEVVEDSAITNSFAYELAGQSGHFKFRIKGKLGTNAAEGEGIETSPVYVKAALDTPEVTAKASSLTTGNSVTLSWKAVASANKYEIYRYSYDQGRTGAVKIGEIAGTSYTDSTVAAEMPYYYYVVARSSDNYSNESEVVWAVCTKGHSYNYVYENESAGITITKRSYNTVFNGKITLAGTVEKAGTVELKINGAVAKTATVTARGQFDFSDVAISKGRNDVEIIVTETATGLKTREAFNYVYLTGYDKVVDAAHTGTDGDIVDDVPTYKTVQAAINSVPSGNSNRVIIFVKEGDYHEHLVVNTPNITLIGEDSEKTRIYWDSSEGDGNNNTSLVGGDMGKRCAVLIDKGATNFVAENICLENTYDYVGNLGNESCDALRIDADNTVFVGVSILGFQDTLCANAGSEYFYKCYIAGNIDFIYGNEPRAYFNDCTIMFRYASLKNSGYVCAPRASEDATYGLTFFDCRVLSEPGCSGSAYYLARPWGEHAYITWINCYMGSILQGAKGDPYTDMSGNVPEKARFFEYNSYGPGFDINVNRRQISANKAAQMTTPAYLGWNPVAVTTSVASGYVGSRTTNIADKFITNGYTTDKYIGNESAADDQRLGLGKYDMEGFATASKVTGGGLLADTASDGITKSENYYEVNNAVDFLDKLVTIKSKGVPAVINLTGDIKLGNKELESAIKDKDSSKSFADYSSVIKAHSKDPINHPSLKTSGVSELTMTGMSNLTLFSSNGSSIMHACIVMKNTTNVIIRNIKFDELWEWDDLKDEKTGALGNYDRNDWDYVTIGEGTSAIWIDHCTFYKSYDGVVDIKDPTSKNNVTISWCEFLGGSENDTFFNEVMNAMMSSYESNMTDMSKDESYVYDANTEYPYYYYLRKHGMTHQQIVNYAYGQKKTHLLGQSAEATSAANIAVTFANNYYHNSMDRMPRLRYGTAHVYNCIMDASALLSYRLDLKNTMGESYASKIVSNGASSTCGGSVLLQNCYMDGIENALNSGNGSDTPGYINAVNTVYMMNGSEAELKVKNNTSNEDQRVLVTNPTSFVDNLPYSQYTVYDPNSLKSILTAGAGAGKLTLSTLQWEKTSYIDTNKPAANGTEGIGSGVGGVITDPVEPSQPIVKPTVPSTDVDDVFDDDYSSSDDSSDDEEEEEENSSNSQGNTGAGTGSSTNSNTTPDANGQNQNQPATEATTEAPKPESNGTTYKEPSYGTVEKFAEVEIPKDVEIKVPEDSKPEENKTTQLIEKVEALVTTIVEKLTEAVVNELVVIEKKVEEVQHAEIAEKTSTVISAVMNDFEIDMVQKGEQPKVTMTVADEEKVENKETVEEHVKAAIDEGYINVDSTVGMYVDISMDIEVGTHKRPVKELNKPIGVTVKLDERIINRDANVKRKYNVVRVHETANGKETAILDASFDEATGSITFYTDKFSTYAVIYTDLSTPAEYGTVVETGDKLASRMINIFVWMLLAAAMFMGAYMEGSRRRW